MTVSEWYGRGQLLGRLGEVLAQVKRGGSGRMLALRGWRQVGKSTTVTRFVAAAGTPYVYGTGVKNAAVTAQLAGVSEAARDADRPLPAVEHLFGSPATSWREFFGRIVVAAKAGPVIVVLDEFPWFAGADPSLEGELQVVWDQELEHLPVLLILIGSDITMMARLNEHDRPLFGRLRPMTVSPLNPTECAMALPGRSSKDVFDACLVTGGFPRLINACAQFPDIGEFVRESLRDELSELVVTARLRLDAEFADASAAYRVLSAIGAYDVGRPGFNDVVSAISDPGDREAAKTATTRALAVLTGGKRLVDIERPAMAPASSKLRRYRISDPYLRFWFRFVENQVDLIARGRADIAIRRFDAGWTTWRGRAVEPVIVDGVTRLAADHPDLRGVEKVQAWWNRDHSVEVDLVAQTEKSVYGIGTIKWRANSSITARDVSELAKQREVVPHAAEAKLIAVVPTAPTADTGADVVLTADDLITAWPT